MCLALKSLIWLQVSMVTGYSYQDEVSLRKSLFVDYDRSIRPVLNQSDQINVEFTLELLNIESMDITTQSLTVTIWVIMRWRDEKLVWDPALHGGADQTLFHSADTGSDIWRPSIVVMNTIGDFEEMNSKQLPVIVSSTGAVTMESGLSLTTHCDADITFYPFDTQSCEIVFGAVVYSLAQLNLTLEEINTENYRKNGEWSLINLAGSRHEVKLDDNTEAQVRFHLTLKRLRPFFVMNLVIPLMLLSSMNVVVFALPVESGERISLAITSLLSFAVFLSVISESLPNTSQNSPIVGMYVLMTFIMSTLSVCLSVIILNLHGRQGTPVPKWLRLLVSVCLGCGSGNFRTSSRKVGVRTGSTSKRKVPDSLAIPMSSKFRHNDANSAICSLEDLEGIGSSAECRQNVVYGTKSCGSQHVCAGSIVCSLDSDKDSFGLDDNSRKADKTLCSEAPDRDPDEILHLKNTPKSSETWNGYREVPSRATESEADIDWQRVVVTLDGIFLWTFLVACFIISTTVVALWVTN